MNSIKKDKTDFVEGYKFSVDAFHPNWEVELFQVLRIWNLSIKDMSKKEKAKKSSHK